MSIGTLSIEDQLVNLDYYFRVERDPSEVENAVTILRSLTEETYESIYDKTGSHSITELIINLTSRKRYGYQIEEDEATKRIFCKLELLQYA